MKTVTIHKAKTELSRLIAEVEAGADVVIMRGREAVARLVPVRARPPRRKFGALAGKLVVSDAFFDPLPAEELGAWEK